MHCIALGTTIIWSSYNIHPAERVAWFFSLGSWHWFLATMAAAVTHPRWDGTAPSTASPDRATSTCVVSSWTARILFSIRTQANNIPRITGCPLVPGWSVGAFHDAAGWISYIPPCDVRTSRKQGYPKCLAQRLLPSLQGRAEGFSPRFVSVVWQSWHTHLLAHCFGSGGPGLPRFFEPYRQPLRMKWLIAGGNRLHPVHHTWRGDGF